MEEENVVQSLVDVSDATQEETPAKGKAGGARPGAGRPKRKADDPLRKQPPPVTRSYTPKEVARKKNVEVRVYHVPEPVHSNVGHPARPIGRPRKRDVVSTEALSVDALADVVAKEMSKVNLKSNKLTKDGKLKAEMTTKNTQAKLSAAKEAETQLTAAKMQAFYKICDANNGLWRGRFFRTAGDLAEFIKGYLDTIQTIGLVPSAQGLRMYLGVNKPTFDSYMNDPNSPLAPVVESFLDFVDEYNSQAGLAMSGNPAFQMFYNKCKLGWQEQPKKVEVSGTVSMPILSDVKEIKSRMNDIPIMDVDYKDVPVTPSAVEDDE